MEEGEWVSPPPTPSLCATHREQRVLLLTSAQVPDGTRGRARAGPGGGVCWERLRGSGGLALTCRQEQECPAAGRGHRTRRGRLPGPRDPEQSWPFGGILPLQAGGGQRETPLTDLGSWGAGAWPCGCACLGVHPFRILLPSSPTRGPPRGISASGQNRQPRFCPSQGGPGPTIQLLP